jgi:hypothetical protein
MLKGLCKAGLPNFSRPAIVDSDHLGCAILGPRRRVSYVLLTGFETSSMVRSDLPPPPRRIGFQFGDTTKTCNQVKGCDRRVDWQLARKIPGLCGTGLASVTAYGWVTETPGRFGHLGSYSREFYEDEVVAVGPPPPDLVASMRRRLVEAGVTSCP